MNVKILGLLMIFSGALNAEVCTNASILPSTDESTEFDQFADGTVIDNSTGLMWMSCALGQSWTTTDNTCTGSPIKMQWNQMSEVAKFNQSGGFAGKQDWRLPNINELRSIVEDCRSDPAINTVLFPNTASAKFWTSSPYVGLASNAWVVDFGQGRDNFELKSNSNYVRLVRPAD